jgi:hypothetical protein
MFDAVITDLKWLVSIGQRARTADVALIYQAIRVLTEYTKWKPFIEKAKAMDKTDLVDFLDDIGIEIGPDHETYDGLLWWGDKRKELASQLLALLSAIPEQEK